MKTVLITGSSRGLGLELSRAFLKNGWNVIATARTAADIPEEISKNAQVKVLSLDVSHEPSIKKAVADLKGAPIDVLINNAGIYDASSVDDDAAIDMSRATEIFQTNSLGPKFVSEALVESLEKGSEKLVVTISSGMGTYFQLFGGKAAIASRGQNDEYTASHWAYSASKTAVNYAMLCFHIVHPDIKSVLINPGWMKTDIGGSEAPLDPRDSAASIVALIEDHKKKLPNGYLFDYRGNVMPW